MAINPEDITTVRIDQLSPEPITVTSLLPHQVGTDLKQGTIQELVDLVATAVGVSGGVGYLAISVTDGQQLPDVPENASFFLCGDGTFLNINGYPNIICTENLNAIMSLTDHWELAVEIPINPLSGTVQSVTGSAVDNTDPLNPVVNITPSSLQSVLDNNHDLVDGNNFQGTGAGTDNTGGNVNAFGAGAASENDGGNVNAFGNNAANNNTGINVNALGQGAGINNEFSNVNLFGIDAIADANNQTVFSYYDDIDQFNARISYNDITDDRKYDLPDASGTLALTSDITGVIPKGTASGTDTYTATVTGVTAYTDGDAYLIRFTNGNTTSATLNLNTLGAKSLYRNNDGALIGGDIWDGAEMLCVFNSTLDGFQCIGTSPNALFSYVTNADSVSITKGMPVYAFGGQGDRMTVKKANNTSDATSAQTVGIVASTSIAAGQKGIIIMQGLLDGLSILPTSTYSDGDAIYLGATAGSITNVKPYAPNHLVYLGVVTTASNGSAGRMYVRIQNGYEMDELHNVDAQSPNNNDGLFYNTTTSLWEHKNVLAVAAERRNANNSTNNNINYCGIAPADSAESASVWTITRLTITNAGAVTTATAVNVEWDDRETATYT
jgi:hypothetical protein